MIVGVISVGVMTVGVLSVGVMTLSRKWYIIPKVDKVVIQRGETDLPVTLIADTAYPLKPWIMKPYSGNLTAAQARFNYSRARMTIERR
jgi:hypothetical protein